MEAEEVPVLPVWWTAVTDLLWVLLTSSAQSIKNHLILTGIMKTETDIRRKI